MPLTEFPGELGPVGATGPSGATGPVGPAPTMETVLQAAMIISFIFNDGEGIKK